MLRCLVSEILHLMAATRDTSRSGRGAMARSIDARKQSLEYVREAKHTEGCNVGVEDWVVGYVNYRIHRQAVAMHH